MTSRLRKGHFQLCVELGLDSDQTGLADHHEMVRLVGELRRLFRRHEIPVTWAIREDAAAPYVEEICSGHLSHEIALLADSTWLAPGDSRTSVISHLEELHSGAANLGRSISSLVLRDVPLQHADVMVGHGIEILRDRSTNWSPRCQRDPVVPRNNMWWLAATAGFPAAGKFLGSFDIGFRAKQALGRAVTRRTTEHIAVRISHIMRLSQPEKALGALDRIIRAAAKLQSTGRLACETMNDALVRWKPGKTQRPQRSVLRHAA